MSVSCGRRIDALWSNDQHSNAWVWLRGSGWRKLDDRNADTCTNLLAIAATTKQTGQSVSVHEEVRGGQIVITELYDFATGTVGPTEEVGFDVSECIYGWRAAYAQRGTAITVRIRLNPDADVSGDTMATLRDRWRTGIEDKWSNRFGCCTSPNCMGPCALTFRVEWVGSDEHHSVRVRTGPGRSNMGLWHTTDSGDVASHEFGHMLGHPDEYTDNACPRRSPVNSGTVMDDNSEVVERLVRPFCERHGLATTTV